MFKTLVDGEELNGAELWRQLWVNNEGGAREVEAADLGALHNFPPCPSGAALPQFLGLWMSMVNEHGMDLPSRHLTTLLLKMLPKDVLADVKKMNVLNSPHQDIVRYLKADAARWTDHAVAQQHIQQRFSVLPGVGKKTINALHERDPPEEPKPVDPATVSDPVSEKLSMVCAALEKLSKAPPRDRSPEKRTGKDRARSSSSRRTGSLPRPDSRFEGCWHCWQPCHS